MSLVITAYSPAVRWQAQKNPAYMRGSSLGWFMLISIISLVQQSRFALLHKPYTLH